MICPPHENLAPATLADEAIDLALSEFYDVSPRSSWSEAQRVGMRKAIATALGHQSPIDDTKDKFKLHYPKEPRS